MTRRVVIWLLVLALGAAVIFGIVRGYEWWRTGKVEEGRLAGRAEIQKKWDDDRARAQAATIEQARLSAAETLRRLNKQQENQRAQDALLASARRDNQRLAGAVDRLQLRASRYLDAAGCGSLTGDSALECVRQAAGQIGIVLGQCAARHRQLAADADDARIRGLKCEADYDSLTLKAAP